MNKEEYKIYLRSRKWIDIRTAVIATDHYTCQACGGTATQVHHKSYHQDVLDGKDKTQLVSLCEDCHKYISLKKRTLKESNDRLAELIAERKRKESLEQGDRLNEVVDSLKELL